MMEEAERIHCKAHKRTQKKTKGGESGTRKEE